MSHSKKLVFFFISVSLGFGISKFVEPERKEEVEIEIGDENLVPEALKIKEKIITKYFAEKDPARKLEISDEVMEKVILLFMANLGIKLTDAEKALVENPLSYEKYLKEVLTLCPSLPKNTGPEVFLNDGSDELKHRLEEQLRTCRDTYGGLNKKPKLQTDEQKRKFINFEDNIFKKYGRSPESVFPFDISSDLWTDTAYLEKLKGFPKSFVSVYTGELEGIYRTISGDQGYIKLRLTHAEKSKDMNVLLNFSLSTKLGLFLKESYSAKHPEGHSNTGKGPCRGMVLTQGSGRLVHLVKVPGQEGYFGRVYSSNKMVSSFFVMKDFSKKKLNPSKWKRDRGYW